MKVLDVGIGEDAHSTKKLIELGTSVTAIDIDSEKLNSHKDLDIELVCADACQLPFDPSAFDLSVAYFTLHEIDPELHPKVISELTRVSKRVMIAEPGPGEDRLYQAYSDIWRRAMHSIGKFEDYRPISYWKTTLEECGANVTVCERLLHRTRLIGVEAADKFIGGLITHVKNYGLSEKYVTEFRNLAEDIKEVGMRFSDIAVVIGES